MDVLRFQSIVQTASEIYAEEVCNQAGMTAVAFHDPAKLKELKPKQSNRSNDAEKFKKKFGSF